MVDIDSTKNACGICHEPAEDPVVSYLFLYLCLSFLKVQRSALIVYINSNFCWCDLN